MLFGVAGKPDDRAQAAADAGYDFIELSVPDLLTPQQDDGAFQALLEKANALPLPVPVCNGFIPGELKITGPDADMTALETYVTTTFERAKAAGVDTIVFGSGNARRIPDGFSRDTAWKQLRDFCVMFAPIASANDVTVVIEPLNLKECNVFTTVGECAAMVREVNHDALQLLVDAYHWGKDHDSADDLVASGPLLKHAHIATYDNRLSPGAEPCDFAPFFRALATGGYNGRISIEGGIKHPAEDLPMSLELMRSLAV